MKKPMNKGYTLIEMIFSLFIFSISISLIVLLLFGIQKMVHAHVWIEDEIALYQLRQILLLSSEIEKVNDDELNFFYLGDQAELILEKERLVRKKGYVIYMEDLKKSYFSQKGKCFYVNYEKENEKKQRFLGCN